jgi:hypothetical protein
VIALLYAGRSHAQESRLFNYDFGLKAESRYSIPSPAGLRSRSLSAHLQEDGSTPLLRRLAYPRRCPDECRKRCTITRIGKKVA